MCAEPAPPVEGFATLRGGHGFPWCPGRWRTSNAACASHDAGDHTVWVGEVSRVAGEPGPPLLHYAGRYRRLAPGPDTGKPGSDRL